MRRIQTIKIGLANVSVTIRRREEETLGVTVTAKDEQGQARPCLASEEVLVASKLFELAHVRICALEDYHEAVRREALLAAIEAARDQVEDDRF